MTYLKILDSSPQCSESENFPTTRFLFLLALYFSLHVLMRVVSSTALELDEAEQVVLSQWLLPGYADQPPLYTWLQIILTSVVGTNVLAVSLLKNILLFLTYVFMFLATRKLTYSSTMAAVASVSVLFIPQISWGAQRDLTHSVLLLASASAFFYVTVRLLETHSLIDYVFFGLAMGLGILSKHNFSIFAVALILACLSSSSTRSHFVHTYTLLSLLIAGAMVSPYFRWAVDHPFGTVFSIHKFHMGAVEAIPGALIELSLHILTILAPLLIVYGLFFHHGVRINRHVVSERKNHDLLTRFFFALFSILILLVGIFHVTKFKNRWLAPLLILVPVYLITRLESGAVSLDRAKRFLAASAVVAMLIILFTAVRIFGARITGFITDLNYPSRAVAEEIRATGFQGGTIVVDRQVVAGDLKIQFPHSLVLCPSLKRLGDLSFRIKPPLVILWEAGNKDLMPKKLQEYVENDLHVSLHGKTVTYKKLSMYLAPQHFIRVGIAFLNQFEKPSTP